MQRDFKYLKNSINHNLEQNQLRYPGSNDPFLEELYKRIQSVSNKLIIFARFTLDASYKILASELEEQTKKIPKPNSLQIKTKSALIFSVLREIELKTIEIFLGIFSELSETYSEVSNEFLNLELDMNLTHKLSYVFEMKILANCHNLDFGTLWNMYFSNFLLNIFQTMEIQFMRNFIKRYLTEGNSEDEIVDHTKLIKLCVLLIENDSNYKFLLKASKVFTGMKFIKKDMNKMLDEYSIEIIHTSCSHKGLSYSKSELTGLRASSKGLHNKKFRNDGFITIGSHPFADVELPKVEGNKEILSAVIFWRDSNYYIQDLSKNFSVIKKMKMQKLYEVYKNMVIVLSKNHIIRIVQTGEFKQNGVLWAYLDYEFIKGTYAEVMGPSQESKIKRFCTQDKQGPDSNNQYTFVIGYGGYQKEVDFTIPSKKISKQHLYFIYSANFNKWTVRDYDSKNGSYLTFKNYDEINKKSNSIAQLLMSDTNHEIYECISIQGFNFFIKPVWEPK